ncbi:MAG: hypothetical protein JWM47_1556 [Acidimicrobiales bacterium]|nr:hypothetical protein [Acidimicrobiales bacterium]
MPPDRYPSRHTHETLLPRAAHPAPRAGPDPEIRCYPPLARDPPPRRVDRGPATVTVNTT